MLAARILIALLLALVAIPPASGARGAAASAVLRPVGHTDPEISAPAGVAGGGLVGVGARPPTAVELTACDVVASLPKTRVWGFKLGSAPCNRGRPELTPSSHWDYRLPYDGNAVGSPLVPKGTAIADDAFTHGYGYHPRIRARGLQDPKAHNFPYSFDDVILRETPVKQADGSLLYRKAGSLNGTEGVYEIAVNPETGTIFHRTFRGN